MLYRLLQRSGDLLRLQLERHTLCHICTPNLELQWQRQDGKEAWRNYLLHESKYHLISPKLADSRKIYMSWRPCFSIINETEKMVWVNIICTRIWTTEFECNRAKTNHYNRFACTWKLQCRSACRKRKWASVRLVLFLKISYISSSMLTICSTSLTTSKQEMVRWLSYLERSFLEKT